MCCSDSNDGYNTVIEVCYEWGKYYQVDKLVKPKGNAQIQQAPDPPETAINKKGVNIINEQSKIPRIKSS